MMFMLDIFTPEAGWRVMPVEAKKVTVVGDATVSVGDAANMAVYIAGASVFTSNHPAVFPDALRIGIVATCEPTIERREGGDVLVTAGWKGKR
jgi:hypothetical protein